MKDHGSVSDEQSVVAGSCRFCNLISEMELLTIGTVSIMEDAYPVTPGHKLILPQRHIVDYFAMNSKEKCDSDRAILLLRTELLNSDPLIEGFNIGTNAGEVAGQTVAHAHIHLIPRRRGDTLLPQGGVRGVIPERMQY